MSEMSELSESIGACIMLEQDGLVVVNKPSGIGSTGRTLEEPGNVQFELMAHYKRMVWAVHQLDWQTTGVNLFVRRKSLVARWADALSQGTKQYLALCEGVPAWRDNEISSRIGWQRELGRHGETPDGRRAISVMEVVAVDEARDISLVKVTIETGRTHQIRVHMSDLGHPVVGDERYDAVMGHEVRVMLHAWRALTSQGDFQAPIPEDMQALWPGMRDLLMNQGPLESP